MEITTGSLVLHHDLANQLRGLQESSGFSTMGSFMEHLFALEEQSRSQQCLSALFEQPWLENYPPAQPVNPNSVQPQKTASVGVQVKLCCPNTAGDVELAPDQQTASMVESYTEGQDRDEDAEGSYSESDADNQIDLNPDYVANEEMVDASIDYDNEDTPGSQNTPVQNVSENDGEPVDFKKPASTRRRSYSGKHPGYSCEECGAKFKHKLHFVHHVQDHRGVKTPTQCKHCPRILPNPWRLKLHISAKHPEHAPPPRDKPPDEPFLCHICGVAMKSKHTYTHHLRSHTDERPYSCPICPRTFKWASARQYHVRTHTQERLYECHLCDKKYRYESNLTKHQLFHTGEKPFSCPHCSQRFTAKPSMKEHVRKQHENPGEKPHICPHCYKAYSRKFSMNCHIKKKHLHPKQGRLAIGNTGKSRTRRCYTRREHVHVGMTNVVSKGFRATVVDTQVPLVPKLLTKTPCAPLLRITPLLSKQALKPSAVIPVQLALYGSPATGSNASLDKGSVEVVNGRSRKHRQAEIELAEVMAGMLSS